MKMNIKRFISSGIILTLIFTLLSGCNKGDDNSSDTEAAGVDNYIAKISELESQVESLKKETVPFIDNKSKNDYILGKYNPAVSEAVSIKEEVMANLPETILIKDIEYSTSLTSLTLSNQNLSNEDIVELKYMVNLEELYIYKNNISDLTPIKGLTNLKTLSLFDNNVSDLKPLEGLVQLNALYLRKNDISDINSLEGLVNLTVLDISENSISDITPLKDITNITMMRLNNNQISEITTLSNFKKMLRLHLQGNNISDISAIANMADINEIYLHDNNITNIEALRSLESIEFLKIGGNPLTNLQSVTYLSKLKKLYIEDLDINDDVILNIKETLPNCTIIN